jgi:VanZ family protein
MRWLRLLFAAYGLALTFLLLVGNPTAWVPFRVTFPTPNHRGLHFLLFLILTLLACACRFRVEPWRLIAFLIAYALLTETLQWWVPPRAVELLDYLENIFGVIVAMPAARRFLDQDRPIVQTGLDG